MGSYIAPELALRYPEKVNTLIQYASLCNPEMYPPAAEVMDTLSDPN
jgi:pimeloyl-ACP methyl ester carboxylesterase